MGGTAEARAALREGLGLVPAACRLAWAPLGVGAAGWTALFVAARAALPPDPATALAWTGLLLVLLMTPSKLGALHRLAAREDAPAPPGPAGLQATAVEARLTATAVALCALAVLLLAALGVAAGAVFYLTSRLGVVGSFGAVLLVLAGLAALLQGLGRLAVTLAADACELGARFAQGWILTRGAGAAPALVLAAGVVAPAAAVLTLAAAADGWSAGAGPGSVAAEVVAGAVLAGVTQFVLAPVNAGALAHLRRRGLARTQATVDTPRTLGDKASPAGPVAASPPEILPA